MQGGLCSVALSFFPSCYDRALLPAELLRTAQSSTRTPSSKVSQGDPAQSNNMSSTTGTDPGPPYLVEPDSSYANWRLHYLSLSSHPSKQDMSHEELRLEHYNASREKSTSRDKSTSRSSGTSGTTRLTSMRQFSGPVTTQSRSLVRTVTENTHEYAVIKEICKPPS